MRINYRGVAASHPLPYKHTVGHCDVRWMTAANKLFILDYW